MNEGQEIKQRLQSLVTRGLTKAGFKYFTYREDESITTEFEGWEIIVSFKKLRK